MSDDAYKEIYNTVYNPNDREYDDTNIATWSSLSQVDTFLSTYTHANAYMTSNSNQLKLGNRITIQDGTRTIVWMIAGFDVESNRTASDGTTYDNGYGIALVPETTYGSARWNNKNSLSGGYLSSEMHTVMMPYVATNLQNVLGSHLISRNVLLSSSVGSDYYSNAYTWTTAYCTLMSIGQMTGTFANNRNKYDDGEANYQLPVFKKNISYGSSSIWLRGVWGVYNDDVCAAWIAYGSSINYEYVSRSIETRPMIYIR